ncbi:hypothetical protein AA11825_1554 [Acetobacter pomorum DSM 11825]|nr:hypothetical protein AA11825_1554 [Acetobacter pomorum DSM 11825]
MPEDILVSFLENFGGTQIYIPKTLGIVDSPAKKCPLNAVPSLQHKQDLRETWGGMDVQVPSCKPFLAAYYLKQGLHARVISRKLGMTIRGVLNIARTARMEGAI